MVVRKPGQLNGMFVLHPERREALLFEDPGKHLTERTAEIDSSEARLEHKLPSAHGAPDELMVRVCDQHLRSRRQAIRVHEPPDEHGRIEQDSQPPGPSNASSSSSG